MCEWVGPCWGSKKLGDGEAMRRCLTRGERHRMGSTEAQGVKRAGRGVLRTWGDAVVCGVNVLERCF
jgi:hypothetical protein